MAVAKTSHGINVVVAQTSVAQMSLALMSVAKTSVGEKSRHPEQCPLSSLCVIEPISNYLSAKIPKQLN